ncbi:MAG: aminoacyl-tRNA hydrolase [Clostridiales bacterium]|nr:aminoacyl-tRNA hydrolase [Clostridiales bacterium]
MKLIFGLGNPGVEYARTRHNAGFMTVDRLAETLSAGGEKKHGKALVRTADAGAGRLLLAKPQSYMNLSGDPLWELMVFYKDGIEDLIVIHDDLDMPLGRLRFKSGGGTGGHKGLKSITARLGSDRYDRLKIGIGRPPAFMATEDYVLQPFSPEEKAILDEVLRTAVKGIGCWLDEGIAVAMNRYNAEDLRPPPPAEEAK